MITDFKESAVLPKGGAAGKNSVSAPKNITEAFFGVKPEKLLSASNKKSISEVINENDSDISLNKAFSAILNGFGSFKEGSGGSFVQLKSSENKGEISLNEAVKIIGSRLAGKYSATTTDDYTYEKAKNAYQHIKEFPAIKKGGISILNSDYGVKNKNSEKFTDGKKNTAEEILKTKPAFSENNSSQDDKNTVQKTVSNQMKESDLLKSENKKIAANEKNEQISFKQPGLINESTSGYPFAAGRAFDIDKPSVGIKVENYGNGSGKNGKANSGKEYIQNTGKNLSNAYLTFPQKIKNDNLNTENINAGKNNSGILKNGDLLNNISLNNISKDIQKTVNDLPEKINISPEKYQKMKNSVKNFQSQNDYSDKTIKENFKSVLHFSNDKTSKYKTLKIKGKVSDESKQTSAISGKNGKDISPNIKAKLIIEKNSSQNFEERSGLKADTKSEYKKTAAAPKINHTLNTKSESRIRHGNEVHGNEVHINKVKAKSDSNIKHSEGLGSNTLKGSPNKIISAVKTPQSVTAAASNSRKSHNNKAIGKNKNIPLPVKEKTDNTTGKISGEEQKNDNKSISSKNNHLKVENSINSSFSKNMSGKYNPADSFKNIELKDLNVYGKAAEGNKLNEKYEPKSLRIPSVLKSADIALQDTEKTSVSIDKNNAENIFPSGASEKSAEKQLKQNQDGLNKVPGEILTSVSRVKNPKKEVAKETSKKYNGKQNNADAGNTALQSIDSENSDYQIDKKKAANNSPQNENNAHSGQNMRQNMSDKSMPKNNNAGENKNTTQNIAQTSTSSNGEGKIQESFQNNTDSSITRYIKAEDFGRNTLKIARNLMPQGTQNARLILTPSSLGTVFVKISLKEKKVHLNITAESQEAVKSIEKQLPALKERLVQQGLQTDKVDLKFKAPENDSQQHQNGSQNSQNEKEQKDMRREFLQSFARLRQLREEASQSQDFNDLQGGTYIEKLFKQKGVQQGG